MQGIQMWLLLQRWARGAAALVISISLAACGAGSPNEVSHQQATRTQIAAVISPQITVIGITKIKETRVNRTVYDYEFEVTIRNSGATAETGITATLTNTGPGAIIIDGTVQIATLAAGATVTARDTVTLRLDRSLPFDQNALVWRIDTQTGPPPLPGILLPGADSANAVSAIVDYEAVLSESDLEIETSSGEATNYRYQLSGVISPTATVGMVNAALNSVGARIVGLTAGSPVVFLQAPPPGGMDALVSAGAKLVTSGAFEAAGPEMVDEAMSLPPDIDLATAIKPSSKTSYSPIVHHVAAGFPQAWNAVNTSITGNVDLIIVDSFGNGALPNTLLSGTANGMTTGFSNGCKTSPCSHGYHVLGIATGSFGGTGDMGKVTGSMPLNTTIYIVDTAKPVAKVKRKYYLDEIRRILESAPAGKRFVLNFSFGYAYEAIRKGIPAAVITKDALLWRKFVASLRGFDYSTRAVQVSAAGNSGPQSLAKDTSMFNAAVLLPTIVENGKSYPALKNGLVVENRTVDFTNPDQPVPGCLGPKSTIGGNISAIGTDVRSFISPTSTDVMSGTSMASPQVAGLVAMMLAVRKDFDVSTIASWLSLTAMLPDSCKNAAPMIHAGDALLSLDRTLSDAPIRLAMLQASGDLKLDFDDTDTKLFLDALFPETPNPKPDFSRFDLNGDGFTGGAGRRRPFDLKFASGLGNYSVVETIDRYPSGTPITAISESGLTDFEILCYYVNSSMFNASRRNAFEAQLAAVSQRIKRTVSCSSPAAIELSVTGTPPDGWTLPNAPIRLVPANPAGANLYLGSNLNLTACQFGERGGPVWSSSVEASARYFTVNSANNLPYSSNAGGPPNARGCSSFYASKSATGGNKIWATASARVQGVSGDAAIDREYQVRYYSGDPGNNKAGYTCNVGYVPNAFGPFVFQFGVTCTHSTVFSIVE
ncbi:S8 family serine peptidase [Massilia sp. 2TAF26]|uniref:S8 family serine peptidase n=1 Tax=Massilia sp. 2TAF26 TaxID=3233012 RepID=UPI003F971803